MWGWHNNGCVWDKVATEWAGDEDWACRSERVGNNTKKCSSVLCTMDDASYFLVIRRWVQDV